LQRALAGIDVADRGVVLVHSGDRNATVADTLRARGARLVEVFPYQRMLPDDVTPVAQLVREVIARRIDVMLFTNQSQCRHLFEVAREMSQVQGLTLGLQRDIVVGAVGPVCARALERAGVTPDVVPTSASMPALLAAVARYFEATPQR
jgi:uroporphyrinogen-III synthase